MSAAPFHKVVLTYADSSNKTMSVEVFSEHLAAMLRSKQVSAVELNELGSVLFRQGAYALAYVAFEMAARDGSARGAQVNLGRCEIRLGRSRDAEERSRRLIDQHPSFTPAWQLLAESLASQGRYDESIDALRHALSLTPGLSLLHYQLGQACERKMDLEAASVAYERACVLDPQDSLSLASLVRVKRQLCDWRGLEALGARLKARVSLHGDVVSPFDFLAEGASAAEELECSRAQAAVVCASVGLRPLNGEVGTRQPNELRVGFISCGFGPHPMATLIVRLIELLRSESIEVHLFATRDDAVTPERRRLELAAHQFHRVAELSPDALARKVKEVGIEILFELDGYSNGRGLEVSAHRAAPIQVSWLGYPGTTGAPFIDYVIADPFVLPAGLQEHFSERVAYLPRCYMSSDTQRVVAEPPSREDCGLPAGATVVYACFNAHFKLNHRSFARMMRVLSGVPGSVLWLAKGHGHVAARLRDMARAMRVDPRRIVFQEPLSNAAYLARYKHVDLYLDTENYGAHTMASDALWAGCPVLTRPGETLARRVAGSLNHYLGMGELNVRSDDEFVAMAIRCGLDEPFRVGLREKLARQKIASGVFDMQGFAKDFAALLCRLSSVYRSGAVG